MRLDLLPALPAIAGLALSTLAACGDTSSEDPDAGAPFDAGALTDAGPPVDAGPFRPAFAPRLVYQDRDVTCAPPPDFTFVAPERPALPPGTVRWAYDPETDPATRDALRAAGRIFEGLTAVPLVGTATGGVVAAIDARAAIAVSSDGRFDVLEHSARDRNAPLRIAPTWVGSASEPRLIVDRSYELGRPALEVFWPGSSSATLPIERDLPLPGTGRHLDALVSGSRPTVLADGSIVWAPTSSTIMASCPDGRTRWILEYDGTMPDRGGIVLYAAADRTLIARVGALYRLDHDGNVVAERLDLADRHVLGGYSEACGLAFIEVDRAREGWPARRGMRFVRGADFSEEIWLDARGVLRPTGDCGAWGDDFTAGSGSPVRMLRFRPDGSLAFGVEIDDVRRPYILGGSTPIELEDGTWLLLDEGGEVPPTLTIIDDETGATIAQYPLAPDEHGTSVMLGAWVLTPDGTLYVATSSRIVAVALGVGPRVPYAWTPGMSWARTHATWHP